MLCNGPDPCDAVDRCTQQECECSYLPYFHTNSLMCITTDIKSVVIKIETDEGADVYMNKFDCCYECYIKFVEGREELWQERKKVMLDGNYKT